MPWHFQWESNIAKIPSAWGEGGTNLNSEKLHLLLLKPDPTWWAFISLYIQGLLVASFVQLPPSLPVLHSLTWVFPFLYTLIFQINSYYSNTFCIHSWILSCKETKNLSLGTQVPLTANTEKLAYMHPPCATVEGFHFTPLTPWNIKAECISVGHWFTWLSRTKEYSLSWQPQARRLAELVWALHLLVRSVPGPRSIHTWLSGRSKD